MMNVYRVRTTSGASYLAIGESSRTVWEEEAKSLEEGVEITSVEIVGQYVSRNWNR